MPRLMFVLLAVAIVAGGCGESAREGRRGAGTTTGEETAWTVEKVAAALAAQDLPLRPTRFAEVLGRAAVPESVRQSAAGEHIVGYVAAQGGTPLSREKSSYMIVVTVFDSEDSREDALRVERYWMRPDTETVRTAQIQKDNIVATYGGVRTEEGLAELGKALGSKPFGLVPGP
jgi:hypothetical protein